MSELGHSRRFGRVAAMSSLASIVDTPEAVAILDQVNRRHRGIVLLRRGL